MHSVCISYLIRQKYDDLLSSACIGGSVGLVSSPRLWIGSMLGEVGQPLGLTDADGYDIMAVVVARSIQGVNSLHWASIKEWYVALLCHTLR